MKQQWTSLWLAVGVLLVAVIIGFNLTPWLRGGFGWRWPYAPVDLARALPVVLTMTMYVLGSQALLRRTNRAWPVLTWSVAGAALMAVVVTHAREGDVLFGLLTRTTSNMTTGPHWAAAHLDWASGAWRDWTQVMARFGSHTATSPPGAVILMGGVNAVFDAVPTLAESLSSPLLARQCHNYELLDYTNGEWAGAWFGILMPLWAGLTALPLYGAARRLRPGADARQVTIWWGMVPALAGFAASWSTFYPLLSAGAFLLLLIALKQSRSYLRRLWALGAGVMTGLATFVNFAFLPLLLLFGLFTLGWFVHRKHVLAAVGVGVWFGLGLLIPWGLFMLAGGDSPVEILRASLDYHLQLKRNYWFWLGMHLWDFALWTGVGSFALMILGMLWWWRGFERAHPPLLALALLLTLIAMTVSATTRGESGRIWLFLAPFVLLAGWGALARITWDKAVWVRLTLAHGVLAVILSVNLSVIGSEFTRKPEPLRVDQSIAHPVGAQFANANGAVFQLTAFDSQASTAERLSLTLRWESLKAVDDVYWFSVLPVGPQGNVTEGVLWQPGETRGKEARYPTTCWTPGTVIEDRVTIPLPKDAAAGEWWVSLAVYGEESQDDEHLRVVLPDGTADEQVGLGPFHVAD